MASKKEYPPLKDAVKSLKNVMTVFTRECKAGSTWARLHTLSDRIFERRRVLEIVYARQFKANNKPKGLAKLPTDALLELAEKKLAEQEIKK